MDTKLTVRVEQRWLEDAKRYAAQHGTSLSRLINAYLRHLSTTDSGAIDAPILRRLTGILPSTASIEDYHDYIETKYGG